MMRANIYSAIMLSTLIGSAFADAPKKFNAYVGLMGGLDHLSGKRSDAVTEDDATGVLVTTPLSSGKSMSNSNIGLSIFGGALWQPTVTAFVFGPEVYFGRSTVKSRFTDVRQDIIPQNRFYSKELERQYNYGFIARAGVRCNGLAGLLAVGFDRGHFKERTTLTYDPQNILTIRNSKSKALSGLVLGVSAEKQIQNFMVGLDFKYTKYRKLLTRHTFDAGAGLLPGDINLTARPKVFSTSLRLSYLF
ncbi:MAG: hypothetical protein KF798_03420 [Candidatus Paracaedibacteraceae bacterium]|nr:hypothetical protein [Candidatus Paracaedibacteraceae bacterium]